MALIRCPKCEAIIDSSDETCKYCGYKVKNVTEPKVVAVPEKDSFSVDGEHFDSVSGETSVNNTNVVSTSDASNSIPYETPAAYSPNRVRELRWGYFLLILINIALIAGAIVCLCFAIHQLKTDGETDAMLTMAVLFFAFGIPSFIYGLVRFIQSFKAPVEACVLDAERKKTQAEVIGNAAIETIIEVIARSL